MGMVRHVLNTQGRTCWICGGRATSADHVTPRSLGGDDTDANLRPACQPCNAKRGAQENPFDAEQPAALNGPPVSSRWGR
jgi:5-methylcytosine-specific restriction endonuclease McrA